MVGKLKKVVFYRHSLLNRGGDKMVLAHASHLAEKGHSVEIWASQVETIFPINNAIKLCHIGSKSKLGTLLTAATFRSDADVLIADIIPLACLLALLNRPKVLYFSQDYDESYYMCHWQRLIIRSLYFFGLTFLRIPTIAVAEHLTDLLNQRFKCRAKTVNNGVDIQTFYPDPDLELINSKEDRSSIVFLSRKDPRKGFDLGLQILGKLATKIPPNMIEVWTVGDPTELGLEGFVHKDFGYVDADRLRKIFSSADAFLYHSRHEGFPLMALEALACGCPMAASNAVPVVRQGIEALISPVGETEVASDHLKLILNDTSVASGLTERGLAFAKKHSLALSMELFENVLLQDCFLES